MATDDWNLHTRCALFLVGQNDQSSLLSFFGGGGGGGGYTLCCLDRKSGGSKRKADVPDFVLATLLCLHCG